jgi:Flp pilus assembly protein TadG
MSIGLTRRVRPVTGRSGQALVEFALIAPILLLLVFGLVDFARAWSAHHVITDAAREGTRMLVIANPDIGTAEAKAAIESRMASAGLKTASATVTFNPANGEPARGDPMTVTIQYPYDFWILGPFINWATGDRTVDLVSTITMRGE